MYNRRSVDGSKVKPNGGIQGLDRTGEPLQKRFMNVQELAEYISVSQWTIYTMVCRRKIPYIKFGRLVRFDIKVIDRWMAKQTVPSADSVIGAH